MDVDVYAIHKFCVEHPYLIVSVMSCFSITLTVITYFLFPRPPFSDPLDGFEARGTYIGNRLITWENLVVASKPGNELVENPLAQNFSFFSKPKRVTRPKEQSRKPAIKLVQKWEERVIAYMRDMGIVFPENFPVLELIDRLSVPRAVSRNIRSLEYTNKNDDIFDNHFDSYKNETILQNNVYDLDENKIILDDTSESYDKTPLFDNDNTTINEDYDQQNNEKTKRENINNDKILRLSMSLQTNDPNANTSIEYTDRNNHSTVVKNFDDRHYDYDDVILGPDFPRKPHNKSKTHSRIYASSTKNPDGTPTAYGIVSRYPHGHGIHKVPTPTLDSRGHPYVYGRTVTNMYEDKGRMKKINFEKNLFNIMKSIEKRKTKNETDNDSGEMQNFCDKPHTSYAHFVVGRVSGQENQTLFSLEGFQAICDLQKKLESVPHYWDFCQKQLYSNQTCCPIWSLPNYAILASNKSRCDDLTEKDVLDLRKLLNKCYKYYLSHRLQGDCSERGDCEISQECVHEDIVFHLIHFILAIDFVEDFEMNFDAALKSTMIYAPMETSIEHVKLFDSINDHGVRNDKVEIVAMDMNLKDVYFNLHLSQDTYLLIPCVIIVLLLTYLYSMSLVITITQAISYLYCSGIANFIYTPVAKMQFFPYMNYLGFAVMIGIGADGTFIFLKVWQDISINRFAIPVHVNPMDRPSYNIDSLIKVFAWSCHSTFPTLIISSITTGVAFFASNASSVTAVKCFGMFTGWIIIANLLLSVTWLPISMILMERTTTYPLCSIKAIKKAYIRLNQAVILIAKNFEKYVFLLATKFTHVWLAVFGTIGAISAFIVFLWPGLQLPVDDHFQLFDKSHPFEKYDTIYKKNFYFEKSVLITEAFNFPLRFVWGVKPIDNGNYWNPKQTGRLTYDRTFYLADKESQTWVDQFCRKIKWQTFYKENPGPFNPFCFIEEFKKNMNVPCIDSMDEDENDRSPCCETAVFPYEPEVFETCLPITIAQLHATPIYIQTFAGPRFASPSKNKNRKKLNATNQKQNFEKIAQSYLRVKVLVIEFESSLEYTTAFNEVQEFESDITAWFEEQLETAPAGLKNGWFTSELHFYDLQKNLTGDTIFAMLLAAAITLAVILYVTSDYVLSFFTGLTVILSILTTMATLILMGWKLNIVESIAMSTAIGLVVDYGLHYGIHYGKSKKKKRMDAMEFALKRLITPTAMAALTTILSGVFMSFATILPYIQIGHFLIIVTSISWLYATFFLTSLLIYAGPESNFARIPLPKWLPCINQPEETQAELPPEIREETYQVIPRFDFPKVDTVMQPLTPRKLLENCNFGETSTPPGLTRARSVSFLFDRSTAYREGEGTGQTARAMSSEYDDERPSTSAAAMRQLSALDLQRRYNSNTSRDSIELLYRGEPKSQDYVSSYVFGDPEKICTKAQLHRKPKPEDNTPNYIFGDPLRSPTESQDQSKVKSIFSYSYRNTADIQYHDVPKSQAKSIFGNQSICSTDEPTLQDNTTNSGSDTNVRVSNAECQFDLDAITNANSTESQIYTFPAIEEETEESSESQENTPYSAVYSRNNNDDDTENNTGDDPERETRV